MKIQLTLIVQGINTPEKVNILQSRLEEIVRLLPHYYEVYQDSGESQEIIDTIIPSNVATTIPNGQKDFSEDTCPKTGKKHNWWRDQGMDFAQCHDCGKHR